MEIDQSIPTINMETFDDLSSILEDEFHDLLSEFLNETPAQLALLTTAIDNSDFKAIYAVSHSQSGAGGNLGLDMFHTLCEKIGVEAKEENITNCRELSSLLNQNFIECKKLLTEKINNSKLKQH